MVKLAFQEVQTICRALGEFGDARLASQPNKDLILTVAKIDGRKTLQTVKLSEMNWLARIVRWLGFGGATLNSVARFLQTHEPYLPREFSKLLQYRDCLSNHYSANAVERLTNLDKETYAELKKQKSRGCEIFKRCLSHHNQSHYFQVYILLQEHERTDLVSGAFSEIRRGIPFSGPNPMRPLFLKGDVNQIIRERYHIPVIDENEFFYLHPFYRKKDKVSPQFLGFCYNFGLGTKENLAEALKNYRIAAGQGEYSACYNLGLLLLELDDVTGAIDSLNKGQKILEDMIAKSREALQQARDFDVDLFPNHRINEELNSFQQRCEKVWTKALNRIQSVQAVAMGYDDNDIR